VNEAEAAVVRMIFERFRKLGSATVLVRELTTERVTRKCGKPVDKGFLYKLLNNRVYLGEAVHKGVAYPGEHTAIIGRDLWDKVHAIIRQSPRSRAANTRAQAPALLKGILFGADGRAMTPTHARKGGRLYRYYVAAGLLKGDVPPGVVRRAPAAELEAAVVDQLRGLLRAPELVVGTWRSARPEIEDLSETEVCEALLNLDPIWDELFPAEQARILQLLVERVDVHPERLDLQLRVDGLQTLVADLRAGKPERKAA
jgi:hypothetical protein